MKKYTEKDIKVLNWEEHVRKNPHMYFDGKGIDGNEIGLAIEYSAKILGANETKIDSIDNWFYFCSDVDWLFKSEFTLENEQVVFNGPCPFPEAESQNSFRCEALCLPFSSDAFTLAGEHVVLLKGSMPSNELLASHQNKLGPWGRIVGYKLA